MVGVGNVDGLDAVDSLGEEDRLADDVESRRELNGIVARAEAHLPRIAHVDDSQTRFARNDVGKAVRDRDLAAVVHAVQAPDDLWRQGIGDIKSVKRTPRDAVERLAVKRNAHRPVVDTVHAECRLRERRKDDGQNRTCAFHLVSIRILHSPSLSVRRRQFA